VKARSPNVSLVAHPVGERPAGRPSSVVALSASWENWREVAPFRPLPTVGTKTWKRKKKAANFVCIEREKRQDRLFECTLLLEIAFFCPGRELQRGSSQADSADYFQLPANPWMLNGQAVCLPHGESGSSRVSGIQAAVLPEEAHARRDTSLYKGLSCMIVGKDRESHFEIVLHGGNQSLHQRPDPAMRQQRQDIQLAVFPSPPGKRPASAILQVPLCFSNFSFSLSFMPVGERTACSSRAPSSLRAYRMKDTIDRFLKRDIKESFAWIAEKCFFSLMQACFLSWR
jgi:hypothetical protein